MKRLSLASATLAVAISLWPTLAPAELAVGVRAPNFATQGALAGRDFGFNLGVALGRGPVVLYFYPRAFTQGCTLEARAFAEAHDDFVAAGATVVGMSNDDIATLRRFSSEACANKFAVARATPQIIRAYDVDLRRDGASTGLASRTSYVISRDGQVRFVHSNSDWRDHVRLTLQAVRALR